MNILYLVFGNNIDVHLQVQFSIITLMHELNDKDQVHVITTTPSFYQHLKSKIDLIPISEQTLKEWRGKHDFFWRCKIKAIEHIAEKYPGQDLMYLDGDTFLIDSLLPIKQKLNEGYGMMHLDEGHPKDMMTKSLSMWKTVKGRNYGGITIGEKHDMWNAGVVAIPGKKLKETVQLALQICDGMLDDEAEPIVIEQYSLSIALYERTHLIEAKSWIGHYWGNKEEWNNYIHQFFLTSFVTNRNIEEEIQIAASNKDYCKLAIHKKVPNTKKRLIRLLNCLFPNKDTFL